jgi:hypothetical protein
MGLASNSTATLVTNMAAQAWLELMAAYGVEFASATHDDWPAGTKEAGLFGVVGFEGQGLRATCLIGAEHRLVEASCRTSSRPRDWISELANQLIGRVKMKLLSRGVNVTMTIPIALSGVQITPLPRFALAPLAFTSERGAALIWLEIEIDEHLSFSSEQPLGIEPGDLVF